MDANTFALVSELQRLGALEVHIALDARPIVRLPAQPDVKLPAGDWVLLRLPAGAVEGELGVLERVL